MVPSARHIISSPYLFIGNELHIPTDTASHDKRNVSPLCLAAHRPRLSERHAGTLSKTSTRSRSDTVTSYTFPLSAAPLHREPRASDSPPSRGGSCREPRGIAAALVSFDPSDGQPPQRTTGRLLPDHPSQAHHARHDLRPGPKTSRTAVKIRPAPP
jgi:hypothetical protein